MPYLLTPHNHDDNDHHNDKKGGHKEKEKGDRTTTVRKRAPGPAVSDRVTKRKWVRARKGKVRGNQGGEDKKAQVHVSS